MSSGPTLREAALRAHRHVGCALATYHFDDPGYAATAAREFDSMTPENQMKWDATEPQPNHFSFDAAERLVAFAEQNQLRVRGHTLVWHSQLAPWVARFSGAELEAALDRHVRGVAGHFRGRIAQWDVVNEAFDDSGALRANSPFTELGVEYIEHAFSAAHAADPHALLFYNDYEIEGMGNPKSEAAFALAQHLLRRRIPLHGVGFQMHVEPRDWPSAESIRANLQRFADLGLWVEITEMDVPLGALPGTSEQKLEQQRALTHDIVDACLSVERCSGITFWGVSDKFSWLNDARWGNKRGPMPHLPLPFDASYRRKPMWSGIFDAFSALSAQPVESPPHER